MKNLFLFLVIMSLIPMFPQHSDAQPVALFVNDNAVFSDNTDTVLAALDGAGIPYDIFNARDSLRSPTSAEMSPYYFVIWYCSTDGVGNYLWNGADADNIDLLVYLENGGMLWLMGTDFLYDRYGSAPDVFSSGDFVHDFLGIAQYNAQAYGDDGGLGVPELDPIELPGNAFPLDTIHWSFSTAWWVDGCTPAEDAVSVYNMGPDTYPLQGLSSAVLNRYNYYDGQKELTFLFDPALIDTYANRVALFEWSYYSLFMPSPPGVKELQRTGEKLIMGQNPVSDKLHCSVPETCGSNFTVRICDLSGKQMFNLSDETRKVLNIDISAFCPGMYMLTLNDNKKLYYQKFVVAR